MMPVGHNQYWAVCIDFGLIGYVYASTEIEAARICVLVLTFQNFSPRRVNLIPIGQRWFTAEDRIELGFA